MSANAASTPRFAFSSWAICFRLFPNGPPGYSAPAAGVYFVGSAAFSIFTASNVSCPVPCSTASVLSSYIAANPAAAGDDCTPKSRMLFSATAWMRPSSVRGTSEPSATARNGVRVHSGQAKSSACSARFSHPSCVALNPGVPDSIKSCASKCDREGSGDPEACTIARCF